MAKTKRKVETGKGVVYQLKITLLHVHPPIWRRIQVKDCTLDKLHEHMQTAMGWTNSHLHQFDIDGTIYGDPQLLDQGLGDAPRTLLEELAKLKSGDVVLPARSSRGGPERQLRLRCVTEPDEAQRVLLDRLGLNLPRRLRRLDDPIQM